jgi:hypothetical protein
MSFIYNTTGSINGFDAFGHFQRSNLQHSTCDEIVATPAGGCEAFFGAGGSSAPAKKKKGKKAKVSKAKISGTQLPQVNVPNIQDLIPQLLPNPGQAAPGGSGSDSGSGTSSGTDSGTTTTTPDDQQGKQAAGDQTVSMRQASMFLQFLLGGGA